MNERKTGRGRLQLFLIAAVFIGPLLVAFWLYYGGTALKPEGRTNHGVLLEPIANLQDVLPGSPIVEAGEGGWLLVYADDGDCGETCRERLYTIRQLRLMLGREMGRLERVFLHGATPPDTLFIKSEHEGLLTLEDRALGEFLRQKKPDELRAGGYYLIDPQRNLVMYFQPSLDPGDIVDDIKRLLRLSRIG